MTSVHPITVVRELIQFGYEPFPTTCGRKYIFFGEEMAILPNILSYMKQLSKAKKFSTLFKGLDSAICVHIIGGTVDGYMWKFFGQVMGDINTDVRKKQTLCTSLKFTLRSGLGG
ncbi:Peptidylprolyl isomerase [Caenorhabditis elegans]|uniref:Peptidylprolyl isomerase n=1 Tax=Caenorhabditis elegans TaxID=6239 RepID=Q95R15_CAEEL|nr:Peptidylprolyl isomerase [Caenorhabditis elegans]CCD63550.2 Peptidylprolyl isomerase [Caenorhabditis elegans]|eukprot:NP_001352246.1 Uncharacterized protein CELE_F43E2.11 [Caenorhabditis elegans]